MLLKGPVQYMEEESKEKVVSSYIEQYPHEPLRENMRSANKLLLTEHKSRNLWGAWSFTVSAEKAWNTLPNNIRASARVCVCKTTLKTHLFKAYFEWYMWTFPWTCSGLYTFYDIYYFILLLCTFLETLLYTVFITTTGVYWMVIINFFLLKMPLYWN